MITDKIDGDLARKHNLITNFGKIADPIADKAMTGMAFIGLSIIGELWWWVTIVVLIREWAVTFARLSIAKHVVIAAKPERQAQDAHPGVRPGRVHRPVQGARSPTELTGGWDTVGDLVWWVSAVLMGVAVVLTITSGLEFAREAVKQRRAARAVH